MVEQIMLTGELLVSEPKYSSQSDETKDCIIFKGDNKFDSHW